MTRTNIDSHGRYLQGHLKNIHHHYNDETLPSTLRNVRQTSFDLSNKIFLEEIVKNSIDIIILCEMNGSILDINETGLKKLLYNDKQNLLNENIQHLLESNGDKHLIFGAELQAEDYVFLEDISLIKKNGEVINGTAEVRQISIQNSKVYYLTFRETKIQDIEKPLNIHSQRLESIGLLAGRIAHDFNNTLTVILANAGLGKSLIEDSCPANPYLNDIITSVDKATFLTHQILNYINQSESTKISLNLNELIDNFIKIIHRLKRKNVTIVHNDFQETLYINGSLYELDQVLMNLTVNAFDALPESGTIKITLTKETINTESVFGKKSSYTTFARINFYDNGSGIDDSIINKIFTSLYTTKPIGKGTGLGLASVKTIIENHNGFVKVRSKPGIGTSFDLYFPLI